MPLPDPRMMPADFVPAEHEREDGGNKRAAKWLKDNLEPVGFVRRWYRSISEPGKYNMRWVRPETD